MHALIDVAVGALQPPRDDQIHDVGVLPLKLRLWLFFVSGAGVFLFFFAKTSLAERSQKNVFFLLPPFCSWPFRRPPLQTSGNRITTSRPGNLPPAFFL